MQKYCLDTNVFIEAKKGPYGFDIVPAFWDWIDQQVANGTIYCSTMVYDELMEGEDELSDWARLRVNSGLFIEPDEVVQQYLRAIADYVNTNYEAIASSYFLGKADPWVIAHAKTDSSIVVTHEQTVPNNSHKVKIPNICVQFSVQYVNPYMMLRNLSARFSL